MRPPDPYLRIPRLQLDPTMAPDLQVKKALEYIHVLQTRLATQARVIRHLNFAIGHISEAKAACRGLEDAFTVKAHDYHVTPSNMETRRNVVDLQSI